MKPIRRILVPTDFGECSAPALRLAAFLAEQLHAELILLHVVQDIALALPDAVMPTPVPAPDLAEMIEAGKQGLANLIRQELASLHPQLMAAETHREAPERDSALVREQLLYAAATGSQTPATS